MPPPTPLKIIFGGGGFQMSVGLTQESSVHSILSILTKHNVTTIDTAQRYGSSEALLGATNAGSTFTLDTKWENGFVPGKYTKEVIISSARESIRTLKVPKVDIFYLHGPDPSIPLTETLAGVNAVYELGLFTRFGLSNYLPSEVRAVHTLCTQQNFVLPTVYQGNYSPVARKTETLLLPTLRELGMSFYAYSPLAGGFLTKTPEQLSTPAGAGRFDAATPLGKMYRGMYLRPSYLAALSEWADIAAEEGVSRAELAYRWVVWSSPVLRAECGDGVVVGASRVEQLEETLEGIGRGALSGRAVERIEGVWTMVEGEAPLDNYHAVMAGGT
ncbi:aldehyde reductase [Aulographum hederae CBS 113979]|uniref:Aldehyde reductase n=1 Tax=Aulographum hederae CBS 113979 TaxID=1176131 RepID=A0A6G1GTI6_9PEZI|nr:aldehyde reductase [Aulographum hederae CBS 113979]